MSTSSLFELSILSMHVFRKLVCAISDWLNRVRYFYEFFYYRSYESYVRKKTGSPDPYNIAAYMIMILTGFQLFFIFTLVGALGGPYFFAAPSKQVFYALVLLLIILMISVHFAFVHRGKWRRIVQRFQKMSPSEEKAADRRYRWYVVGSIVCCLFTLGYAILYGLRVPGAH